MRSPEQVIADAARIDAFMKDEAVGGALSRMERRFYEEFIGADSSEARVKAWAKANVLRDLERELKIIVDAGEHEVLRIAKEHERKKER